MSEEVVCPNGHKFQVDAASAGKQVPCPECGQPVEVPRKNLGPEPGEFADEVEGGYSLSGSTIPKTPREETAMSTQPSPALPCLTLDLFKCPWVRVPRHALLLVGLVLVLLARGCDAIGNRSVARSRAALELTKSRFDDKWQAKFIAIDEEIEQIDKLPEPTANDRQRLMDRRKERTEQLAKQKEERTQLERGKWRDLSIAARDAASNNLTHAYWRELLFIFGSICLSLGLVIVGFCDDGPERWVCLVMLAIITFSLYIGGEAWVGALQMVPK
ncbi:MAG: hypothetical protein ACYC35_09425 [Pirellulales bacterium]